MTIDEIVQKIYGEGNIVALRITEQPEEVA